jgi:DNA replication ATP-dependent helicase/nuclease Dna2
MVGVPAHSSPHLRCACSIVFVYVDLSECSPLCVLITNWSDVIVLPAFPPPSSFSSSSTLVSLVAQGKRVLLTSYTHSAVNTLLEKLIELREQAPDHSELSKRYLCRIGRPRDGQSARVQQICVPQQLDQLESFLSEHPNFQALADADVLYNARRFLGEAAVVACTCLSSSHQFLSGLRFDYCVMDEASQITFPVSLMPLRLAERFVLIGDHYQLPPLVRSQHAAELGLAESLFRQLSSAHPQAVVELRMQYRMNQNICALANHMVYSGKLSPATPAVAEHRLWLQPSAHAALSASCVPWLQVACHPSTSVLLLNTDALRNTETRVQDLLRNQVVCCFVEAVFFCVFVSLCVCVCVCVLVIFPVVCFLFLSLTRDGSFLFLLFSSSSFCSRLLDCAAADTV